MKDRMYSELGPLSILICFFLAMVGMSAGEVLANEKIKLAVFNIELLDTSMEGELLKGKIKDVERKRLLLVSEELRRKISEDPRYEVIDNQRFAGEIKKVDSLRGCEACVGPLAEKMGADYAITAVVQKISTLILNVNLFVRRVRDNKMVKAYSADIRSNTDRSWLKGIGWLTKNRLLAQEIE